MMLLNVDADALSSFARRLHNMYDIQIHTNNHKHTLLLPYTRTTGSRNWYRYTAHYSFGLLPESVIYSLPCVFDSSLGIGQLVCFACTVMSIYCRRSMFCRILLARVPWTVAVHSVVEHGNSKFRSIFYFCVIRCRTPIGYQFLLIRRVSSKSPSTWKCVFFYQEMLGNQSVIDSNAIASFWGWIFFLFESKRDAQCSFPAKLMSHIWTERSSQYSSQSVKAFFALHSWNLLFGPTDECRFQSIRWIMRMQKWAIFAVNAW